MVTYVHVFAHGFYTYVIFKQAVFYLTIIFSVTKAICNNYYVTVANKNIIMIFI